MNHSSYNFKILLLGQGDCLTLSSLMYASFIVLMRYVSITSQTICSEFNTFFISFSQQAVISICMFKCILYIYIVVFFPDKPPLQAFLIIPISYPKF